MKELIANTEIKRDNNYLYFTGTDDNGNITIMRTERSKRSLGKKK